MIRFRRHLIPLVLASLAAAPAAGAVEQVEGGAVADPALLAEPGAAGDVPSPAETFGGGAASGEGTAVLLDFTPRGAGLLSTERADAAPPRFRLELGVAAEPEIGGLGLLGDAGDQGPSWLDEDGADAAAVSPRLSLGGTLSWSDWSLGGGLERAPLLGDEADLLSATLGYGALSANLAFGRTEGSEGRHPLDVLTLSADIGGWSWLTVESDVALGKAAGAVDDDEEASVAVGRLGVRLNF